MSPTPIRTQAVALSLAAVMAAALAVGCAKKAPAPPPAPPSAPTTTTQPPVTPPPAPAPDTAPSTSTVQLSDLRTVYFPLDSSTLDDAAKAVLDADAKLLRDHSSWAVKVEGNCDERGTVEYNQALGQRRAEAVRDYLVAAGVESARLTTLSYGKENPAVQGDGEAAWAKNRRVDFAKP